MSHCDFLKKTFKELIFFWDPSPFVMGISGKVQLKIVQAANQAVIYL